MYVNVEGGLQRVRSKKLYQRMLQMFLDSKECAQLEEALAAGDTGKAAEAAHTVKGVAGNLSLDSLFETSTALMNGLRDGTAGPAAVEAYRDSFAQTRSAVQALLDQWKAEG
jgi:HPt (histidine-containing phosphotransfer) domain-containing protein